MYTVGYLTLWIYELDYFFIIEGVLDRMTYRVSCS